MRACANSLYSTATLVFAVLARLFVHWLGTGLPLTLLAPVLGAMLALPEAARWPVTAGLALGTPILVLLGGVGAALTVSLRSGGAPCAPRAAAFYPRTDPRRERGGARRGRASHGARAGLAWGRGGPGPRHRALRYRQRP